MKGRKIGMEKGHSIINKRESNSFSVYELLYLSWLDGRSVDDIDAKTYPECFRGKVDVEEINRLFLELDYLDIIEGEEAIEYLTLEKLNEIFTENQLNTISDKKGAINFLKTEFSLFYIQNIIGKGYYKLMNNGEQVIAENKELIPYHILREEMTQINTENELIFKTTINILGMSKFLIFFLSGISYFIMKKYVVFFRTENLIFWISLLLGLVFTYCLSMVTYPKYIEVSKESLIVDFKIKKYIYEIESYEFTLTEYKSMFEIDNFRHLYDTTLTIYKKGVFDNEFILGKYLKKQEIEQLSDNELLNKKLKKKKR